MAEWGGCPGSAELEARWSVALSRASSAALAQLYADTDFEHHGFPDNPGPVHFATAQLGGKDDCRVDSDAGQFWVTVIAEPFLERWAPPGASTTVAGVPYLLTRPFLGLALWVWLAVLLAVVYLARRGG